ncbi:MAG TPA: flagellar export protein FliJ [Pirellulales bacterium]|jgi:flagellar export protein FliJ
MGKFKFRLETLINLHQTERDRLRRDLAEALSLLENTRARQNRVTAELQVATRAHAARAGIVDIARLQAAGVYIAGLRQDEARCTQEMAVLNDEIVRRREALLAGDREVRTLEKLRENQHVRFRADQQRRDQRQFDELASRASGHQADF